MTSIDPTRLISIISSLTTRSTDKGVGTNTKTIQSNAQNIVQPVTKRFDRSLLKDHLRQRLKKLDEHDERYLSKAAEITVNEVLQWEFGNRITSHPEYSVIIKNITGTILSNTELMSHLKLALAQLKLQ